jgi:hypothetical protein
MTATATLGSRPADAFSHEAFFYDGRAEFVRGTSQFIREGLERDESVLVAVAADKIADLRSELGRPAALRFVDMAQLGRNPARIIPAWRTFLDANLAAGRRVRGIGEPIWPDREPAELVESQHHEALLNLAFGGSPHWRLLCPYDVGALRADVIEEAYRSHPW